MSLLFRGQGGDHRNVKGNTSVKPTLFRPEGKGNPDLATLERRFACLRVQSGRWSLAINQPGFEGWTGSSAITCCAGRSCSITKFARRRMLEVTHSIRIAASFASLSANDRAYLFVLGVPNLSGAVTASA